MSDQNAATANEATNAEQNARMFFATITPDTIAIKTSKTGTRYATMKGATVATKKRGENTGTVMAFGKALEAIENKLSEGQPVDLAVVRDGGTLNVVGLRWTKEERTAFKAQRQAA